MQFFLVMVLCSASAIAATEGDKCTLRWQLRLLQQQAYEKNKPIHDLNRLTDLARASGNKTSREKQAVALAREKRRLKPSKLRLLKQVSHELKESDRGQESIALDSKIQVQESLFQKESLKEKPPTPFEEQIVRERMILTSGGAADLKGLAPRLQNYIRKRFFIEIAKNPLAAPPQKNSTSVRALAGKRKISFSFEDGAEYRILYHVNEDGKAFVDRIATRETVY